MDAQMPPLPDNTDALFKTTRASFLIPNLGEQVAQIDLEKPYSEIFAAFNQNIDSIISVASVPFTLASSSVHQDVYKRMSTAAYIRAGHHHKNMVDLSPNELELVRATDAEVAKQFHDYVKSHDGSVQMGKRICEFLLTSLQEEEGVSVSYELLLQCNTSLWTAFEVLTRDLFTAYLNRNPQQSLKLLRSSKTNRRFDVSRYSLADISEYNFDLSDKMGDILSAQQDMSDYLTIKATYQTLFEDCQVFLDEKLDRRLLTLNRQRHLIVHKRGIIDKKYCDLVGGDSVMGQKIEISPDLLEQNIDACSVSGRLIAELFSDSKQPIS